jgi:hypothetical protein
VPHSVSGDLSIGKNPATENPAVLQVVNRGIDLIQRVSMRDEVVQLELAFAVPANRVNRDAVD